jgi:hypothetical protein
VFAKRLGACEELFPNRAAIDWEKNLLRPEPNLPLNRIPSSQLGSELGRESSGSGTQLAPPTEAENHSRLIVWIHRLSILSFVFLCAVVGVLLVILPWRPEWTDNHLLAGSPQFQAFISQGFVRGLCSGLGVLDIWIGFWEAVHYHEEKRI